MGTFFLVYLPHKEIHYILIYKPYFLCLIILFINADKI